MNLIYDKSYYERHLKYAGTETEKKLNIFRKKLVKKAIKLVNLDENINIVDYGCSHGAFIKEINDFNTIGVEINPFCIAHCVKNGQIVHSPEMFDFFYYNSKIDIMTFWDVLEHLSNPVGLLNQYKPKVICLSLPCLDGWLESNPSKDIQLWKHWRPLEHLWNFTEEQCVEFLKISGYEVIYSTFDESDIRIDSILKKKNIMSFVATRR